MDMDGDGIDDGGGHDVGEFGHGWGHGHGLDYDGDGIPDFAEHGHHGGHHGDGMHYGGWGSHYGFYGVDFDYDTATAAMEAGRAREKDHGVWFGDSATVLEPRAQFAILRGVARVSVFPHDYCSTQALFRFLARQHGCLPLEELVPGTAKKATVKKATVEPRKGLTGEERRKWRMRMTANVEQWDEYWEVQDHWFWKYVVGQHKLDTPERTYLQVRGETWSYPEVGDASSTVEIGVYSKSYVAANLEMYRWDKIQQHLKVAAAIAPLLTTAIASRPQRQVSRDRRRKLKELWDWADAQDKDGRTVDERVEATRRRLPKDNGGGAGGVDPNVNFDMNGS